MPKRSRSGGSSGLSSVASEASSDSANQVVLNEPWDCDRLKQALRLPDEAFAELDFMRGSVAGQRAILNHVAANLSDGGLLTTTYTVAVDTGEWTTGRQYTTGLQGITRSLRRLCAGPMLRDIDVVNCFPEIFRQIVEKVLPGTKFEALNEYVDDREGVISRVLAAPGWEHCARGDVKDAFLITLHNGKFENHVTKAEGHHPAITAFVKDVQNAVQALQKSDDRRCRRIWGIVSGRDDKKNKDGSFAGWLCQEVETEAMQAAMKRIKKEWESKGVVVAAWCFDGLMIYRSDAPDDLSRLFEDLERHIFKKTGFKLRLAEKSCDPSEAERAWLDRWKERVHKKPRRSWEDVTVDLSTRFEAFPSLGAAIEALGDGFEETVRWITHDKVWLTYGDEKDGWLKCQPKLLLEGAQTGRKIRYINEKGAVSADPIPKFVSCCYNRPGVSWKRWPPWPEPGDDQCFSTWTGWAAKEIRGGVDYELICPIVWHIYRVLADRNADTFNLIISWMHRLLTNPGVPTELMMAFNSPEGGTGKSLFFDAFGEHVIGLTRYHTHEGLSRLGQQFDGFLRNKALLVLEETVSETRDTYRSVLHKLKALITSKHKTFENKHENINEKLARNGCNFVALSNDPIAIPPSDDGLSRRLFISAVSNVYRQDLGYFRRLVETFKKKGIWDPFNTFVVRDLATAQQALGAADEGQPEPMFSLVRLVDIRCPPMTRAKELAILVTADSVEKWIMDADRPRGVPEWKRASSLYVEYAAWCGSFGHYCFKQPQWGSKMKTMCPVGVAYQATNTGHKYNLSKAVLRPQLISAMKSEQDQTREALIKSGHSDEQIEEALEYSSSSSLEVENAFVCNAP